MKFTKETLNKLLDSVINEYFADDNESSLGEVIDYVKGLYKEERDTLE